MRVLPILALLLLTAGCLAAPLQTTKQPGTTTREAIVFDTDEGAITVMVYEDAAPQSVALMRAYVKENYYNDRSFGRIVPGHVIQVVDAAGLTDDTRTVPLETAAGFHFSAGAVGIARGNATDSGGPEIFIMDFATSHLDGNYTVWGQVVDGMDAVHRIARGPALESPKFPTPPRPLPPESDPNNYRAFDRMAIAPVRIRSTTLTMVTEAADAFPLQVAKNVRSGDLRHSLEWPPSLWSGSSAELTWYIRPYNGTVPPDAAGVRIRIDGTERAVLGEPELPGVYHFRWAAPDAQAHQATFVSSGKALATLSIQP